LVNQAAAPTVNQVPNLNGQSNENTIGDRITTVVTASGETGTISYQQFMDNFVTTTQTYFQTVVNKSKDALNQYNNAILQNWSSARIYTKGHFLVEPSEDVYLFGKPDSIQQIIDKVTNDFVVNIESTSNNETTQDPFMFFMTRTERQFNEKAIRELRKNFVNYVKNKKGTFQNALTKINQDMVNAQQTYLQFVSRANTAPYNTGLGTPQLDGLQEKNGFLKLYKVSGTTQVSAGSTAANTQIEMTDDIKKIKTNLNEFYTLSTSSTEFNYQGNSYKGNLVYGETKENTTAKSLESVVFNQYSKDDVFTKLPFKREYMLLSNDLKSENYQTFKNALIGNIIGNTRLLGNGNPNISQEFDNYWTGIAKPLFEKENALTQAFLNEMETNKLKNFIKYTPFQSKTRLFDYELNTNPSDNEKKLIKALGASTNQSTDKATWNDPQGTIFISKVKLN